VQRRKGDDVGPVCIGFRDFGANAGPVCIDNGCGTDRPRIVW